MDFQNKKKYSKRNKKKYKARIIAYGFKQNIFFDSFLEHHLYNYSPCYMKEVGTKIIQYKNGIFK